MSIYDKASLVLIPSGTKTSKVYSQKPVNGDGDFTFSRSTAATRVNADGNIEKETQNLLLQSNSFNTTWTKLNVSVTGGQADKDGGTDAWLLQNTAISGRVYQTLSASGVLTYSVYAKAGNVNWMALYVNASPHQYIFFDLANVAIGTDISGNSIDATITDEGSGWVRCSVSLSTNGNTTDFRVFPASANGGLASSGQNIYIQDAQLEQGLVARDYIETTTAAVEGGITDNVPRLDYTDSSCPALLLEPQRTNLIDYSEYYDVWFKASTTPTFTENYGTSPEGVQNSTRVQLDNNELFYRTPNAAQGAYVFSVFAKDISGGGSKITLRIDVPATKVATFDLSDGSIDTYTSDNALIEDYGNGWYRCMLIQDNDAIVNAVIAEGETSLDCEIYGAQLEAGSYATSYIPTYGSAVTRNQDLCYITNLKNDVTTGATEGSVMIDFTREGYNSTGDAIQVYGDSSNGRGYVYNTGVGFASDWGFSFSSITYGNDYKILYRLNTLSTGNIFLNGSKSSDASGTSWGSINAIYLRGNFGTLKIRQVLVLTTALSDADAIDLTT